MKTLTNPRALPTSWFGGTAKVSTLLALGLGLLLGPSSARAVVETFNTETNFNWQAPLGVTNIMVECWGGGGAGGSAQMTTATGGAGGGGAAAGAYAVRTNVPVTPLAFYNITIPARTAGLAAGTFASGDRTNGATVTVIGNSGITVTAAGGEGGACHIGNSFGTNGFGSTVGCVGDVVYRGGNGAFRSSNSGGAGGGGPSDLAAGGDASNTSATGGIGATGSDAGHNGGNGGNGRTGQGNGNAGFTPAGGGAGAKSQTQFTDYIGGTGGSGQIILTYTLPPSGTVKANNANNLDQASSWTAGIPSALEAAIWNSTVTSANTVFLGSDITFGGITISNPAGPVTIEAGNTLTLGSTAVDINMSAATANLTLNCPLVLGGPNVWDVASGRTLTLGGQVSGAQAVTKQGAGKVILSSTLNDYSGATTISGGTLQLGATQVIGPSIVQIDAGSTFDMNGFDETVSALNSSGTVDNTAATPSTLTLGSSINQVVNGTIQQTGGGTLTLVKGGSASLALGGTNTYSGGTVFNSGTMSINNSQSLGTGDLTVGGTRIVVNNGVNVTNAIVINANSAQSARAVLEGSGTAGTTNILSGPITINAAPPAGAGHFGGNPSTLLISGPITSTFQPFVQRLGTIIYTGGGTGYTDMDVADTALVGANNGIATSATVRLGVSAAGTLDLNGFNQTLAGITKGGSAGTIGNSSTNSDSTLTTTGSSTFAGTIVSGLGGGTKKLHLVVAGGSLTLTATNTYQGNTTVDAGTLSITVPSLSSISTVTVTNSGVLDLNFAGGETNTVAALVLGGVNKAEGVYNNSTDPTFLTGLGNLRVVIPPPPPANITWDAGNTNNGVTIDPASGTWNKTESNLVWNNTGTNQFWVDGSTATFGGADGTYAITLATNVTAAGVTFTNSGYTVSAASPQTITLSGNLSVAAGKSATLGTNVTVTRGPTMTIGTGPSGSVNSGTLEVASGATARVTTGSFNLDGNGTVVNVTGFLGVTAGTGSLNLGSGSTNGITDVTLRVKNGGQVRVDQSGTSAQNNMQVGYSATGANPNDVKGTVIVENGGLLKVGATGDKQIRVGQFGSGTLTVEGLVQASLIVLGNGGDAVGTLNLQSGGVAEIGQLTLGKPNSIANFNGGTLKATATQASFLNGTVGTNNVRNGGLSIDSAGFDIGQVSTFALTHSSLGGDSAIDGGLTKNGAGILTLNATNSYTGPTTVNGGTLAIVVPSLATNSTVTVSNGAVLQLDFAGGETNVVGALVLGGVSKPAGVYNNSTDPTFLTGLGSLQVIASAPPATPGNPQNVQLVGGNLIFSITNSSGIYRVQGATNLASPVWVDVATNTAPFNFTNSVNAFPRRFFRTVTP